MSQDEVLSEWMRTLLLAFEIPETEVDVDAVLSLAGKAAHAVVRPAAPLTTFVAGYAAGLAAGSGQAPPATAIGSSLQHGAQAVATYAASNPADASDGAATSGPPA